jgi:PAS domain S-box-containing protein
MVDESVAHAEARLRSVLDSAPNAIITADRDGRILFLNRTIHHEHTEQVIGRSVYDLVPKEDSARVRACIASVLETGVVSSYEIRYPRASKMPGAGRTFRVNAGPVHGPDGITGITLVSWDITEQVELQARLMAADRLASVGLLAAGVAHEVNNPLTYVLAHLRWAHDLVAEGHAGPRSKELGERIDFALDGLQRIATIMRDLRSVAHGEEVSVAVDVNRVLDASLRVTQHEVSSRTRVIREYAELPTVRVAESRLGQVFVNLIVNAAQSMNGTVDHHELRLSTRLNGDGEVEVDVTDTGTGIPPELVDRVFEPFVTTKHDGGGTGLGLFVCARLVKEMGARIAIMRTDSTGTTVRITVPIG